MGRYLAYAEYKNSKVEWLGEIPKHWEVWKATHGFKRIGSGTTPKSENPLYYDGDTPWITTSELRETVITDTSQKVTKEALEDYSALRLYQKGSLAIAMYGATIGRLGILGIDAAVNQACCVFAEPSVFDTKFFYYWLWMRRPILISLSTGGGQPNLSQDDLKQLRIPIPPLEEQRSIARFLDHKTAQIDALIAKKETLLKKLAEKRTALISQAVTKGCDCTVPMKNSGIEWLDEIPAHWTSGVKLSYLSGMAKHSFVNGPFGSDLLTTELVDEGVPVIYSGNVKPGRFLGKSNKYVTEEKAKQLNFCRVDAGDLLLAKVGDPPGDAAVYPKDCPSGIVTQDVVRIKVNPELAISEYLSLLMNSKAGRYIVQLISVESTRGRFSLEDFKGLRVFIPPVKEQQKIVNVIASLINPLEQQELKVNQAIKHLKEYRNALITNAVTGKIDVRNVIFEPEPVKAT